MAPVKLAGSRLRFISSASSVPLVHNLCCEKWRLNVNIGKVNLETCWPAVYLVGRPTCWQCLLVTHVLTGPALLHSPIVADQSHASWPLCSPPPSPTLSMFFASLHWFSSVTGAVVLGGHRVALDTASVGHYCIWWPFHHHANTPPPPPPANQWMSFNEGKDALWKPLSNSWYSCNSRFLKIEVTARVQN